MKRGRDGICRRGCCWTPQGVCARGGDCTCHLAGVDEHARREAAKQKAMRHADELTAKADEDQQILDREQGQWTQ